RAGGDDQRARQRGVRRQPDRRFGSQTGAVESGDIADQRARLARGRIRPGAEQQHDQMPRRVQGRLLDGAERELRLRGLLVALVAVVLAGAAAATAASLITGGNVKDGSLTGKDFKRSSLTADRLARGVVPTTFAAPRPGEPGPAGPAGANGANGADG